VKFDRMHHPVSHTAAIVAGFFFIVLMIYVGLSLGIRGATTSPWGWLCLAGLTFVLLNALLSYFRPGGRLAYVTVTVAAVLLLVVLVWAGAHVYGRREEPGHVRRVVVLAATPFLWAAWTYRKFRHVHESGGESATPPRGEDAPHREGGLL
jgi:hypothetical protein